MRLRLARLRLIGVVISVLAGLAACAGNPVDKATTKSCRAFFEAGELETAKAVCERVSRQGFAEGAYYLSKMASSELLAYQYLQRAQSLSPRYQTELDQSLEKLKLHLERLYDKREYAQALEINRALAKQGVLLGQMNLAHSYRAGLGVEQNTQAALSWYQKAQQNGSQTAAKEIYNLSRQAFEKARKAYKNKDYAQALAQFKALAKYDHIDALGYLGDMHYRGHGTPKALTQAADYYRQAADLGGRFEAFRIGVMLRSGKGVKKDLKQAFRYFEQAANKQYKGAYYFVAYAYANAEGVAQNYQKARYWYEKAIALKDANASYFYLANLYQYGLGGEQDLAKAANLYSRISPQNNKALQSSLRDLAQMQAAQEQHKGSPVLFGQKLYGARRVAMRHALAKANIKPVREQLSYWADRYQAGAVFPGVKDLYMYYSHASDDVNYGSVGDVLAEVEYKFGRQKSNHIEEIKSLLVQKYGQPNKQTGRLAVGEMRYSWSLDGVEMTLERSWPATELTLRYRIAKFYNAMHSEIKSQQQKDKLKKYQGAKHAF